MYIKPDAFEFPNKDCDGDCRFRQGPATSTLAYYEPVYDKAGENVNPNTNTTTCEVACHTCGKKWIAKYQNGTSEYTEVK